ncbi:uncharacterized protein LOC110936290 isoform X2 [Helianthus annuus]|nr:uncharacterized protein LOC110936290 isoform X2 [Helianthus annuus]XP_022034347.1 uncharacterized protein LOC110936290 isoform X2 [Helianthus annuus]
MVSNDDPWITTKNIVKNIMGKEYQFYYYGTGYECEDRGEGYVPHVTDWRFHGFFYCTQRNMVIGVRFAETNKKLLLEQVEDEDADKEDVGKKRKVDKEEEDKKKRKVEEVDKEDDEEVEKKLLLEQVDEEDAEEVEKKLSSLKLLVLDVYINYNV